MKQRTAILPGDGWMVSYIDEDGNVKHEPVLGWEYREEFDDETRWSDATPLLACQDGTTFSLRDGAMIGKDKPPLVWHPKASGKGMVNNNMAAWAALKGVEI